VNWTLVWNSLLVSGAATIGAVAGGFFAALWLAGLPALTRTIFVLRAVAGFTSAEAAGLLAAHGGPRAAGWTTDAVREFSRQGLCSLASQLLHAANR